MLTSIRQLNSSNVQPVSHIASVPYVHTCCAALPGTAGCLVAACEKSNPHGSAGLIAGRGYTPKVGWPQGKEAEPLAVARPSPGWTQRDALLASSPGP